uniref:Uncharacterized protein n=1 Tax=Knipowitschia caucasica TaxID=637954 RepID=A0AAV2JUM8_KNICA
MSGLSLSSSLPRSGLSRAGPGAHKPPPGERDLQGNRSYLLRIGERLMRAGSEGNLVRPRHGEQSKE